MPAGVALTIQEQSPPISTIAYRPFELSKSEQDRQLVLLHLQGDPDAFSIIAENHYRALTARARSLLGPHGEVEDAVQETFLRALRALPRFGMTGEYKVGAWLTTILSNVCSDQRTRASRDRLLAESAGRDLPHHADVADQVSDPQTVESLKAAIDDLTPSLRRAFVRHELDDVPYSVMAEDENSSVELARQQVHRAKTTLRRNLAGIESVAGGALALPFLRSLRARLAGDFRRQDRSIARVLGVGHRLNATAAQGRFGRATPSLFDRMATQVTGSPLGQSAIALWSGAPRGSTIVFGMAAAVATLSAGAVIVSAVSPTANPAAPASHTALVSPPAPSTVVPSAAAEHGLALPLVAPPTSTSTSGSGSAGASSAYSWVDAGTGSGGGPATAAVVPLTAAGACAVPPAVGQSAGPSGGLGLSNAQSVASAPAVALPTVGPTVQFSTAASLSSFGSAAPGSVNVTLTTNACASSQGAWFSAQVSGVGTAVPLQLNGTLVEVIGTTGDLGYIFRGDVAPVSGLSNSADPLLDGATQFVAQLEVTEPANLAQLTVVFLNPTVGTTDGTATAPSTTTESATTAATATAPATGATGTGVSTGSAESSPVSLAAAGAGFGQIGSGVPMALPAFSAASGPSISFPSFGPG
jgi:RNA polymerase sigma-70 factor, ECF subfamily